MGISDEGVRLTLRLPESLRDKISKRARKNFRSLNSEIVTILENAGSAENGAAANRTNQINEEPSDYQIAGPRKLSKANAALAEKCAYLSPQQVKALLPIVELLATTEQP